SEWCACVHARSRLPSSPRSRRQNHRVTFSPLDALIVLALAFGFVTFTAAIAVEFVGPVPLPWWARSCVPSRRGANLPQHIAGASVFILLTLAAAVIVLWTLVAAIAG